MVHRVRLHRQRRDHAEVRAAARDRPQQVLVLVRRRRVHDRAARRDHLRRNKVVGGEAVLAREVAGAAVRRQADDARVRVRAGHARHAVLLAHLVHVTEAGSACPQHADGMRTRGRSRCVRAASAACAAGEGHMLR